MFKIVVRAKRDADAVRAALERFKSDWNIEIRTLGGVRSVEAALDRLKSIIDDENYYLVLIAREDEKLLELEGEFGDNVAFQLVNKNKIRNARLTEIYYAIERGRAKIRNIAGWTAKAYHFTRRAEAIICRSESPATDVFLGFDGAVKLLSEHIGDVGSYPLFIRDFGGLHHVYSGPIKIAELTIPDEGFNIKVERISNARYDVELRDLLNLNRSVIELHEHISMKFLENFRGIGDVIVPWSGGKDSTCALILALRVFKDVVPVFIDTGLEFPETIEYVEEVSRRLGLKVEFEHAGIDRELRSRGLPSIENRWCTKLKISALYRAIRRLSDNPVVVVGDRDVESRLRSMRAPARRHEFVFQLAPMKFWPTWLAQLYPIYVGLPLNRLYIEGFYRIGCYICPALRSWERLVMRGMGFSVEEKLRKLLS